MAAFVILLSEDPDADEKKLQDLAAKHKIKNVPLTIFDGSAGPPRYKIAKEADVNVMMWKRTKVASNHAFAKGKFNADTAKAVAKDTSKILD